MRIANRAELADLLSVSVVTVDNWTAAGCPFRRRPVRRGVGQWEFEVGSVVDWLRDRERTAALGDLANVTEIEARRRKLAADAAMAEHELAVAQGKATAISDVETLLCRHIWNARAKFLGIGATLAPQVARETDEQVCRDLIDSKIFEGLSELGGFDPGSVEPEAQESEDAVEGRLSAVAALLKKIRNAAAAGGRKDRVVELCDAAINTLFAGNAGGVQDEPGRAESASARNDSSVDPVDSPAKANRKRVGRPVPAVKPRRK